VILIVGQNAAWQKVCTLARLERGEVNRIEVVRAFASSKGPNVARSLAALHGEGEVLGYAGGANGELVQRSLAAEGIRASFVTIAAETRVCTTFIEPSGASTEVIEPPPQTSQREREEFRAAFHERLSGARVLVIAGSTVAGETEDSYAEMVREARRRSVVTLLDSACAAGIRALAEGPEILKVNLRELGEISRAAVDIPSERVRAWRSLASRHGIRWFLVSMGAAGMEAFDGTAFIRAEPPAVRVVNPIGSGDAATAGVGWTVHEMLSSRMPNEIFGSRSCLAESLACATAMGTANCMNPMNGKVVQADYRSVRPLITVREAPIP
jgi:tagatose 6-phosphate kinase